MYVRVSLALQTGSVNFVNSGNVNQRNFGSTFIIAYSTAASTSTQYPYLTFNFVVRLVYCGLDTFVFRPTSNWRCLPSERTLSCDIDFGTVHSVDVSQVLPEQQPSRTCLHRQPGQHVEHCQPQLLVRASDLMFNPSTAPGRTHDFFPWLAFPRAGRTPLPGQLSLASRTERLLGTARCPSLPGMGYPNVH